MSPCSFLSPACAAARKALLLGVLASTIFALRAEPANAEITSRGDFETGNVSQYDGNQATTGNTITGINKDAAFETYYPVVQSPRRQGSWAWKVPLEPGDAGIYSPGTEHVWNVAYLYASHTECSEHYYAASFLFPVGWRSPYSWGIFWQFLANNHPYFAGPQIAFNARQSTVNVDFRTGQGSSGTNQRPAHQSFPFFSFTAGKWQDVIVRIRWGTNSGRPGSCSGLFEAWHREEGEAAFAKKTSLLDYPTLMWRPDRSDYSALNLYIGLYRSAADPDPITNVMYHDGMRRGLTFEDVAADFSSASGTPGPSTPDEPAPSTSTEPAPTDGNGSESEDSPSPSSGSESEGSPSPSSGAKAPEDKLQGGKEKNARSEGRQGHGSGRSGEGFTWDGRSFSSADVFRFYLQRRGVSWDSFLEAHPAVVTRLGIPSIRWGGRTFFTRATFAEWLKSRGASYPRWAATHATSAVKLDTRRRINSALRLSAKPRPLPGRRILVRASAFPGSTISIVVRDRSRKVLGMGRARADRRGRVSRIVSLPLWRGQQRITLLLRARSAVDLRRKVVTVDLSSRQVAVLGRR